MPRSMGIVLALFLVSLGKAQAPTLVKDINPNAASSQPLFFTERYGTTFFVADDGIHGCEPWLTDGTRIGTKILRDTHQGPNGMGRDPLFTQVGDRMFFIAETKNAGFELFSSDGTVKGTKMVKDINPGTPSSRPGSLFAWNDKLLFSAFLQNVGLGLWISDGTKAGTKLLKTIFRVPNNFGNIRYFTPFRGKVFFWAMYNSLASEIWVTDGTKAGTKLVQWFSWGSFMPLARMGNRLYFAAGYSLSGRELWVTDGTPMGTKMVIDINPGPASSDPNLLTPVGNKIFFTASDPKHGIELWVTDGTKAGTKLVKDIFPGHAGSRPRIKGHLGNKILFVPHDTPTFGRELWVSDGTSKGTKILKDINPGSASSLPENFVRTGSRYYYFTATTSTNGRELWRTDGTPAGTKMIPEIQPGPASSKPSHLGFSGGMLFMSAAHPTKGEELYRLFPGANGRPVGYGCSSSGKSIPTLSIQDPVLGTKILMSGNRAAPSATGIPILGSPVQKNSIPLTWLGSSCRAYFDFSKFWTVQAPFQVKASGSWSQTQVVPNLPTLKGLQVAVQILFVGGTGPKTQLSNAFVLGLGN